MRPYEIFVLVILFVAGVTLGMGLENRSVMRLALESGAGHYDKDAAGHDRIFEFNQPKIVVNRTTVIQTNVVETITVTNYVKVYMSQPKVLGPCYDDIPFSETNTDYELPFFNGDPNH